MSANPEQRRRLKKLRDLCVGATVVDVRTPRIISYSFCGKRYTSPTEDFFRMTVERDGKRRTFTVGGTDLGWWVIEVKPRGRKSDA